MKEFHPILLILLVTVHRAFALTLTSPILKHEPIITTRLKANIASSIILNDLKEKTDAEKPVKERLSRPERKAQEREAKARRKNAKHRKHNYAARYDTLKGKLSPGEGRYDLHSNLVSSLNTNSTADDVIKAIKRAQNLHDVHDMKAIEHFLLERAPPNFAYGYMGSLLSRMAVAALHMEEQYTATKLLDVRKAKFMSNIRPMESSAIIRGLLRVHNVTDAFDVLNTELALPEDDLKSEENQEIIKEHALSLSSIASRHFFELEPRRAIQACEMLKNLGPIVRKSGLLASDIEMPWARIVEGASQCESKRRDVRMGVTPTAGQSIERMKNLEDLDANGKLPCNLVYPVLAAMTSFPTENDDRTYELMSNALIRRVLFITGAVDMDGCPEDDRGEVAFIGRSNVGKSSLVNMVTNRKTLAYTSKTPGKTQQFNYFAVNDKPGRIREIRFDDTVEGEKDPDSFYIVDLPGFGFAQVPDKQRQDWSEFMSQYVQTRKTLKVIFHLVDARHGPTSEDVKIMKQLGQILPRKVNYVAVLTKTDKNMKGGTSKKKKIGKVTRTVMEALRLRLKENNLGRAPVILTSAETKLGRDDIWRYLKIAAET